MLTLLLQTVDEGETTPLDNVSDFVLWGMILAAAVPWIAAVVNRQAWPSSVKWVVFAVVSVIVAAGNAYFNRTLDWHNWSRSALLIIVAATVFYQTWKPAVKDVEARSG